MNKGEIPLRLTLRKQNIEAQAIAERFSCQYEKSSDIVEQWGPTTGTSHSYTLKFMQEQSAVSPEDPSADTSLSCSEFLSSLQLTWVPLQSKYLCTATKCGTEPIRYVMLHFQDRRGTVSLYYRNHTKITVLMRGLVFRPAQELQLYPVHTVGTTDYKRGPFNY